MSLRFTTHLPVMKTDTGCAGGRYLTGQFHEATAKYRPRGSEAAAIVLLWEALSSD